MSITELLDILNNKNIVVWKEGCNVKFKAPKGSLTDELKEQLKINKSMLLEYLDKEKNVYFKRDDVNRYEEFDLTEIQSSYLLGRNKAFELGGVGCHGYMEIEYNELLDKKKIEIAWNKVIKKHDMLRAIIYKNGKQKVQKDVPFVEVEENFSIDEKELVLREKLANKQYKIGEWPMCDIAITKINEKTLLHFSVDMIVADYISMNIILKDLEDFYYNPEKEVCNSNSYRDIVIYEKGRKQNKSANSQEDKKYWENKIGNMGNAPFLPTLKTVDIEDSSFLQKSIFLNEDMWSKLSDLSKNIGVTVSALVMSVLSEIVYYWSGTNKFCINTTLFKRSSLNIKDINEIVGDFTDVNVSAIDIDSKLTFKDRIINLQKNLWMDMEHNSFSGVEVLRMLSRLKGESVVVPLVFTSTVGLSNENDVLLKRKVNYKISQTPQVYIDCQLAEERTGARINWDIRKFVFDQVVIDEMFAGFVNIIKGLCKNPHKILVLKNPVELPENILQVRNDINSTQRNFPKRTLGDGFLKMLNKNPEKTALVFKGHTYSYRKLSLYVSSIMEVLKNNKIGYGDRIAVNIEKNEWQIASVLAIVLSGAVYVPIDVDQPINRKNKILKKADVKVVLSCDEELSNSEFKNINLHNISLSEFCSMKDLNLEKYYMDDAYVIFTSGTTGEPKGVRITHDAAMNTIIDVNERYRIQETDVFLGLAKLSFDLSVYDIFGCFDIGGTLVLPESDKTNNSKYIYDLMLLHRVTIWNSVPAQMQLIVNYLEASEKIKKSEYLKLCMLSGDWIPTNLPSRVYNIFENVKLVSMGGATEASIWSIYYDIDKNEKFDISVPYGYPMSNQKFFILNRDLNPCPDYVKGGLYIGGKGISKGYIGDEKLNKEQFIRRKDGGIIYKTGDTGYYLKNGLIIFTGRESGDGQIKIHGYRIELSEIEDAIVSYNKVDSAQVVYTKGKSLDGRINAVVTPKIKSYVSNDLYLCCDEIEFLKKLESSVLENMNLNLLIKWGYCADQVSLKSILGTFQHFGIFTDQKSTYNIQEIKKIINVPDKLDKLLKRWLNVLVKEKILKLDEEQYQYLGEENGETLEQLWSNFYKVENEFNYSKDFFDYLKKSNDSLPELITGIEDPLNLLFPKGDLKPALASYHDNKINRINNRFIANEIHYLCNEKMKNNNKPFRILEVGAGVGGTTIDVITKLKDSKVEYYFTDVSEFFFNNAKNIFHEYDWIKYKIFDINEDFYKQGLDAFSFDLILCANVLHNSRNIDFVIKNLKNLLVDSGTLIILEETKMSYMLLTSMEFKDGLIGFEDERKESEQTFFSKKQWEDIIDRNDGSITYAFPSSELLEVSGQSVFVTRFKNEYYTIDKTELFEHLNDSLPNYMIPSDIKILQNLPKTSNGKINKEEIISLFKVEDDDISIDKSQMTEIEKKIEDIWCKELNKSFIGLDENFYSVGGDSLLIAQIISEILEKVEEAKDWDWSSLLTEMMQTPTIREISKKIQNRFDNIDKKIDKSLSILKKSSLENDKKTAKVLFHAGTGTLSAYTELLDYIIKDSNDVEDVLGFSFGDEAEYISMKTEDTFKNLGEKYGEVLCKLGYSKYILIGHCVGGLIAIEAANYITNKNMNVSDVTLLSTTIPREQKRTVFHCLSRNKYDIALKTSLENELLLERTFSRLINADIFKAGHTVSDERLDDCIKYMVKNLDGDLKIQSFERLVGEYEDIGLEFKRLSSIPISERLNNLYNSINRDKVNLLDNEIKMLNTLFNIFSQNFGCVSTYKPPKYNGNVRVFSCEETEKSFYGEFFGEDNETWEKYLAGNIVYSSISGQHFDCLTGENLKQNSTKILKFINE